MWLSNVGGTEGKCEWTIQRGERQILCCCHLQTKHMLSESNNNRDWFLMWALFAASIELLWRQMCYECDDALIASNEMKICANDARKMVSNQQCYTFWHMLSDVNYTSLLSLFSHIKSTVIQATDGTQQNSNHRCRCCCRWLHLWFRLLVLFISFTFIWLVKKQTNNKHSKLLLFSSLYNNINHHCEVDKKHVAFYAHSLAQSFVLWWTVSTGHWAVHYWHAPSS